MKKQERILKQGEITLLVRRGPYRRLCLRVLNSGKVVVNLPFFYPWRKAREIAQQKEKWIRQQQERMARLCFLPPSLPANKKEEIFSFLKQRVKFLNSRYYGYFFQEIKIKDQKSRWGSCSPRRVLSLNWRIYYLPPALRDYVIIHEICHLQELNHGPNFWRLVSRAIPDYCQRRQELKKYAF